MTASDLPRVRKDWARNREALLAAAERTMAEAGLRVPGEVIATEAGVSIATFYRHFPNRDSPVS